MNNFLRTPPHNTDAEKAVLGSVMIRPDVLYEIADKIKDDSFYAEKNKIIWRAISQLNSQAIPIDVLSVSSYMKEKGELDKVGGLAYLTDLMQIVPSAANAEYYAAIVEKKHLMRKLIEAGEGIELLGYNENGEMDEILDQAEKRIFNITNYTGSSRLISMKETLGDAWDRIEKLADSKEGMRGVSTGFKGLDNKLSGFQKSDLIILAARPSVGKTSLALDIARKSAINHNVPVGIFSLEMSSQQLVDRMLSAESLVDAWKLRTGSKLSPAHDFGPLREAMQRLSAAPIYIDDQPGNNIIKMKSTARRLKSEKGLGLIIVDYLQLMVPTQARGSDNVVQQVTEISRSLKNLARELEVPVLALSQLSRAVEQRGGEPRLSDLRDSGSIEQDADVVMFIHREDRFNENKEISQKAKIIIAKHRNGPTGEVMMAFDGDKTSFMDVDKSDFGDFASV